MPPCRWSYDGSVSFTGLGKAVRRMVLTCHPLVIIISDSHFLEEPHADKRLMEELLHKTYNISSVDFNKDARGNDGDKESIFASDELFIIRPSILTNGQARRSVRTSEGSLSSAWWISRKDVAAYIVGNCLLIGDKVTEEKREIRSSKWKNGLVISY
jgi:hypothetical protein